MMMEIVLRHAARIMAAACGASGIFFLWASFYAPRSAMDAIMLLMMATVLVLAVPEQR